MKFLITRTSDWGDEKPCEGVVKKRYDDIEIRTLKSVEAFDKKFGSREGGWLSKGENHTINKDGYIQRTHKNKQEGWFIEIKSLEDLMKFKDAMGCEIIVSKKSLINKIEIYDGYRE